MRENLFPALVGIIIFAGFVGFLAIRIGELPLTLIIGLVLVLCVVDFVRTVRSS